MNKHLLVLVGTIYAAACGAAADFTVVNPGDDALPGSLRYALSQAELTPESDQILFDASLMGGTIHLTAPAFVVTGDTRILGDVDGDGQPDITIDESGYTGESAGVVLDGSDILVRGLRIESNVIAENGGFGLSAEGSAGLVVTRN